VRVIGFRLKKTRLEMIKVSPLSNVSEFLSKVLREVGIGLGTVFDLYY